MHYQPILSLAEGRVIGAEALVRLQRRTSELAYPDSFIPVAERVGLISAVGAQVVIRACSDLAMLRQLPGYGDMTMAVNISPHQLGDDDLFAVVRQALEVNSLPASSLILELTESIGLALNYAGAAVRRPPDAPKWQR